MAKIGMQYPVAAQVDTEVEGQDLTYKVGMVIDKAMTADVTWNGGSNILRGDDEDAENDNRITSGDITFGATNLSQAMRAYMMNLQAVSGKENEYELVAKAAPYVGFGYIRVIQKDNKITYLGLWYYKTQWKENSESDRTKQENTEWGTPTLNGHVFGVRNDASGLGKFRREFEADNLAAVKTWLNALAGITEAAP